MVFLRVLLLVWIQVDLLGPDMLKLPLLFVHYHEHLDESADLGFNAFLALHYDNSAHEEADHNGHENLPFHHHHGAAVDQQVAKVIASDPLRPVSFPASSARAAIALPVHGDLLAGHDAELLRPPRPVA